jgi:hypothetical protein
LTSRRYLLSIGVAVLGPILALIAYDLASDDFGLFWSSSPKRIWDLEKTSKYLLSYRYVPRHFDALLIGPSYSDGFMDTRMLTGYRVYNMSMDGANASELRVAVSNALRHGHFRFIVICLSPYITKDSGIKGSQINNKEYWGSLFSLLPLQIMSAKWHNYWYPENDLRRDSTWGDANLIRPIYTWQTFTRIEADDPLEKELHVDPTAYGDLGNIVAAAHGAGVRVFAYYFPNSVWRSQTAVASGEWMRYQQRIGGLFTAPGDVVWDMMTPAYQALRADAACYTDGHLSAAGARLVLQDIKHHLDEHLRGFIAPAVFPYPKPLACLGKPGAGSGFDQIAAAATP